MRKILIASHGCVASGVKSLVKILVRDDSAITAVDCYLDESDPTVAIRSWIDAIEPEDEAVIFTDLLGGSVCNNVTMMKPEEHGIIHVTGINVACVLECLLCADPLTVESVDEIITAASKQMVRVAVNEETVQDGERDDDFFA